VQVLIALSALPLNAAALGGRLIRLRHAAKNVGWFLFATYAAWYCVVALLMGLDVFGVYLPFLLLSPFQVHRYFLWGWFVRTRPERLPHLLSVVSLVLLAAILSFFFPMNLTNGQLVLVLAFVPLLDYPVLVYLRQRHPWPHDDAPGDKAPASLSAWHLWASLFSTNSVQVSLQLALWLIRETHPSAVAYAVALAYQIRVLPMLASATTNQLIIRQPQWVIALLERAGAAPLVSSLVLLTGLLTVAAGFAVVTVLSVGGELDPQAFYLSLLSTGVVVAISALNSLFYATDKVARSAAYAFLSGILLAVPFLVPGMAFGVQWCVSTLLSGGLLFVVAKKMARTQDFSGWSRA
jgi:hypothetical protein